MARGEKGTVRMQGSCRSIVGSGAGGLIVDIECRLANNLPTIVIVGFAGRAVSEAKHRVRAAFAASKLQLPRRRITINLAPTDIPKADSGLDAAIAVAVLEANQQIPGMAFDQAVLGELSLDGRLRPVRGVIGKLLVAKRHGINVFFIPKANIDQAGLIPDITLYPVDSLLQLYRHLVGIATITSIATGKGTLSLSSNGLATLPFDGIIGHDIAKRVACIAAAGGHNLLLTGPPGGGKSLIARAIPALLPAMNSDEILEVTHLHSLASNDYNRLITERPLRAPHHSLKLSSLIGGGQTMQPGEISRSHRGVLLLDELPEFQRATLEALRQPLEDKIVRISRSQDTVIYPADFMLIATANPCPCGFADTDASRCTCSTATIQRYRSKLSGPLLDRIDLYCVMGSVDANKIFHDNTSDLTDYRSIINRARARQFERYGLSTMLNSGVTTKQIHASGQFTAEAKQTLTTAANALGMSTRAFVRTMKIARTIADLDDNELVTGGHVAEAIRYRRSSLA